jgi:hypothetical protein
MKYFKYDMINLHYKQSTNYNHTVYMFDFKDDYTDTSKINFIIWRL